MFAREEELVQHGLREEHLVRSPTDKIPSGVDVPTRWAVARWGGGTSLPRVVDPNSTGDGRKDSSDSKKSDIRERFPPGSLFPDFPLMYVLGCVSNARDPVRV